MTTNSPGTLLSGHDVEAVHYLIDTSALWGMMRNPVDLLIAATAELSGIAILHYDQDYEAIAKLTGQPIRWLAPPGSVN